MAPPYTSKTATTGSGTQPKVRCRITVEVREKTVLREEQVKGDLTIEPANRVTYL
jgi:hypothetical protein